MINLREIAIRLRIEPLASSGLVVPVKTVIKVLTDINKSYANFLEIEFLKIEDFNKVYRRNAKALDTIKEELRLQVVDLKFGGFEVALAPDTRESSPSLFNDEVKEWKSGIYEQYKDDILRGDYANSRYMNSIAKLYGDSKRKKIFKPLFSAAGESTNYKLHLLQKEGKIERTIVKPESKIAKFYTAHAAPPPTDQETKTVHFYATVKSVEGDIKKSAIKKVLYSEELPHATYPYKPTDINHGQVSYVLSEALDCDVAYEEEQYLISHKSLTISVKGEDRKEAEEEFCAAFDDLYQKLVVTPKGRQSAKSKTTKKILETLVKDRIVK